MPISAVPSSLRVMVISMPSMAGSSVMPLASTPVSVQEPTGERLSAAPVSAMVNAMRQASNSVSFLFMFPSSNVFYVKAHAPTSPAR